MKAEINKENKAKFLALYCSFGETYRDENGNIPSIERITLPLKPLSSISDEDAADLCRLINSNFPDDSVAAVQGRQLLEYFKKVSNLTGKDWLKVSDFLRSRSFALPWMGLSVEEMCEAGWIKLSE